MEIWQMWLFDVDFEHNLYVHGLSQVKPCLKLRNQTGGSYANYILWNPQR